MLTDYELPLWETQLEALEAAEARWGGEPYDPAPEELEAQREAEEDWESQTVRFFESLFDTL